MITVEIIKDRILTEGLSSILFHATSLIACKAILSSMSMKTSIATTDYGDEHYAKSGKLHYISFARTKRNAYSNEKFSGTIGGALITFDGQKLQTQNTGQAVDFFSQKAGQGRRRRSEAEDRIVTNKTEISLKPSFIKKVEVFGDTNRCNAIQQLCHKNQIPFYFYKNPTELLKGTSPIELSVDGSEDDSEHKQNFTDYEPSEDADINQKDSVFLENTIWILNNIRSSEFLNNIKQNYQMRKTAGYWEDDTSLAKGKLFDIVQLNRRPRTQFYEQVSELIQTMQKYKIQNLENLARFLKTKIKEQK